MKADIPSMVVYMEKLEGKYAADAWNMPGLVIMAIKKIMPILGLRVRDMVAKRCDWQIAHAKARPERIK